MYVKIIVNTTTTSPLCFFKSWSRTQVHQIDTQHFCEHVWMLFRGYFIKIRVKPNINAMWMLALIYSNIPADTRRWNNVSLMLVHSVRRWTNVKLTLIQRLVSAVILRLSMGYLFMQTTVVSSPVWHTSLHTPGGILHLASRSDMFWEACLPAVWLHPHLLPPLLQGFRHGVDRVVGGSQTVRASVLPDPSIWHPPPSWLTWWRAVEGDEKE